MEKSALEKATQYNDPAKSKDWTSALNDREAFKDEYIRLKNDGGPGSPTNYNKIESPGKNYYLQDM